MSGRERWLWVAGLLLFVVGDGVTTIVGIRLGAVETGAGASMLVDAIGLVPALVVGKTVAVTLFVGLWWLHKQFVKPRLPVQVATRWMVPFTMLVLGGVVTVWNLWIVVQLT